MHRRLFLLAISLILVAGAIALPASGMGQPPSACNNLYASTIQSASVTYPGGTLDPLAHPGSTIVLNSDQTYNLTVIVKTAPKNNASNTSLGTIWYSDTFYGFSSDVCSPSQSAASIGPSQKVNVTFTDIPIPPNIAPPPPSMTYSEQFSVYAGENNGSGTQLGFKVQWVASTVSSAATTTNTVTSTLTQTSTSMVTATQTVTQTGGAVTGTVTSTVTSMSTSLGTVTSIATVSRTLTSSASISSQVSLRSSTFSSNISQTVQPSANSSSAAPTVLASPASSMASNSGADNSPSAAGASGFGVNTVLIGAFAALVAVSVIASVVVSRHQRSSRSDSQ